MIKEDCYYWIPKIEKLKNVRFCDKYKDKEPLDFKRQIYLIEKLAKQGIKKICWVVDDVIDEEEFTFVILFAKTRKISCELLFYDLYKETEDFAKLLRIVDEVTLCIDSAINTLNVDLGRSENYSTEIYRFVVFLLLNGVKVNLLTMINSKNLLNSRPLITLFKDFGINTWKTINYIPILANKNLKDEDLEISKINFRAYPPLFDTIETYTKKFYTFSDYTITRYYNIILPDGDVARINYNDSIIIGNARKDNIDTLKSNFKKIKRKFIPKIKDKKVTVYIANEKQKIINDIMEETKDIPYVEIVGTSTNGKQALKDIKKLKPDLLFTQYDFKDIPGNKFTEKLYTNMLVDCPFVYLFTEDIDKFLNKLKEYDPIYKFGAWIGSNEEYNKDNFADEIKAYKKFRDIDL